MQTSIFNQLFLSVFILTSTVGCRTGNASGESSPPPLKFGVYVKFYDLPDAEADILAKAFEAKAQVYQTCSISGQEFNFRFSFEGNKKGELTSPKLISQTPDRQGFAECFLKHFSSLRLPKTKKAYRGEAQLGAYGSEIPEWLKGFGQKVLEK